jgi:hypothetical protein
MKCHSESFFKKIFTCVPFVARQTPCKQLILAHLCSSCSELATCAVQPYTALGIFLQKKNHGAWNMVI